MFWTSRRRYMRILQDLDSDWLLSVANNPGKYMTSTNVALICITLRRRGVQQGDKSAP